MKEEKNNYWIKQEKRLCNVENYALHVNLSMCNVQSHSVLGQRQKIDLDINIYVTFYFSIFFSSNNNIHVMHMSQEKCTCMYLMINCCTSTISVFVRLSCGSLYSVYFRRILSISVLAYWNSLLPELKMIRAISQSHRMLSSYAFFINPNLRLVKVT